MSQARSLTQVQPAGMVSFFANSTTPKGWLKCDGSAVSRTAYSDLFAAIGTTYGAGDTVNTFNVPDLRGEFIRGWDDAKGTDTGRAIATSQADAYKSHRHSISGYVNQTTFLYSGGGGNSGIGQPLKATDSTVVQLSGGTETRPRNIAMLACIKY